MHHVLSHFPRSQSFSHIVYFHWISHYKRQSYRRILVSQSLIVLYLNLEQTLVLLQYVL